MMMKYFRLFLILGYCVLSGLPIRTFAGTSDIMPLVKEAGGDFAPKADTHPSPIMNRYGMKFVYIPPGKFQMGSPLDESGRQSNEYPHPVRLSKGFYMMKTEVTQRQWIAVTGDNPAVFSDCGLDCPVENVSWADVYRFIVQLNRLSEKETEPTGLQLPAEGTDKPGNEKKQSVPGRMSYHLPTEAQWEYACRAKTHRGWFHFEGDIAELDDYAWFKGNAGGHPHPVALKKANLFGLHDMHGNVWEWCRDYAGPYPTKAVANPTGPKKGAFRIARGGSWYYPAIESRVANRLYLHPGIGNYNVGFRLVMTP